MLFEGRLADLDVEYLSCVARAGSVAPRLGLNVKIRSNFEFPITFLHLGGELWLQTPKGNVHLGLLYHVSTTVPFQPIHIISKGDAQAFLGTDLEWEKIERIEEERSDDLILGGKLSALCAKLDYQPIVPTPTIVSFFWTGGEIRRGNVSYISIYQTEWHKFLSDIGYGKRKILEVILPAPPLTEIVKQVFDHLEAADKAMWQGDYDLVEVSCRKAVEELDRAITEGRFNLKERLASDHKAEAVEGIKKRLKEFLSMGAHPGTKITRRDAEFALLMTKSLVTYVGNAVAR